MKILVKLFDELPMDVVYCISKFLPKKMSENQVCLTKLKYKLNKKEKVRYIQRHIRLPHIRLPHRKLSF